MGVQFWEDGYVIECLVGELFVCFGVDIEQCVLEWCVGEVFDEYVLQYVCVVGEVEFLEDYVDVVVEVMECVW